MARIYLGARAACHQTDNPEYLVQAAHSLRDLMEKMPRFLGVAPVASEMEYPHSLYVGTSE